MPQSIPYSKMTSTMILFKGHSWQTSRHKASMMLLALIMTLRMVTSMKRNFSKESSPLYILFWLLHFKQKRGENWSKNLKEMPGPSSCNYIITIQNQMLHNMTSSPGQLTSPTSPSMTAGKEQSDNSSATSRRNSDCLTALSLFLINFLKLQESHFFKELSNKP